MCAPSSLSMRNEAFTLLLVMLLFYYDVFRTIQLREIKSLFSVVGLSTTVNDRCAFQTSGQRLPNMTRHSLGGIWYLIALLVSCCTAEFEFDLFSLWPNFGLNSGTSSRTYVNNTGCHWATTSGRDSHWRRVSVEFMFAVEYERRIVFNSTSKILQFIIGGFFLRRDYSCKTNKAWKWLPHEGTKWLLRIGGKHRQ